MRVQKKLVLLLWLTNLALALAVALPMFAWLGKLHRLTEAEVLLERFSLPVLVEVGYSDISLLRRIYSHLFFWMIPSVLVLRSFISGGVLTVLTRPERVFLRPFLVGGARYLVRFLKLMLLVFIFATPLLLINIAIDMDGVATRVSTVLLQAGLTLLIVALLLLVLHYARIETVISDSGGMVRVFGRSLLFVFRNFFGAFGLFISFALAAVLVYLLYGMLTSAIPARNWLLILLLIAIQQVVVIVRTMLQIGLQAAEIELFRLKKSFAKPPNQTNPSTGDPAAALPS